MNENQVQKVRDNANMDFHDVARYSALQCMDEGTHVFVGVVE